MSNAQTGVLGPVPRVGRYLTFQYRFGTDARAALNALASLAPSLDVVVGLGDAALAAAGGSVDGLRAFPAFDRRGVTVPSTPAALWCWVRGDDLGNVVHASRKLEHALSTSFDVQSAVDAFKHKDGHDLTGYEDGTENPTGDDAVAAAVDGAGASFVAVQQWVHDLSHFESLPRSECDNIIGRRREDNEELQDAPPSAHVKRTAQENFEPEAFVVRRSMPWSDGRRSGLVFVAFGRTVDAFEGQLRRMVGEDDGIVDGLFRFTRPITGAYFWCPPIGDGQLDSTCPPRACRKLSCYEIGSAGGASDRSLSFAVARRNRRSGPLFAGLGRACRRHRHC